MAFNPTLLVATGLHRGRNRRSPDEDELQFKQYLNNDFSPNSVQQRMDIVDNHITFLRDSDVTNYGVGEDVQKVQRQERQLNALLAKAERGIQLEKNYVQLFWIAIFAAIYLTMLIVQGEIFLHYSLESSVHTTIINQLTAGNGLMYGNALFADKGSLPSSAQFYSWLSSSILQRVLTQPACGDGICDTPTEYPGFGRFGCIPDCGTYTKTTPLTIDLKTFLANKISNTWDLSNVTLKDDPSFTYNIYSDTMGDFLFANDMNPNVKSVVDVPDGNLTLHLYQTASMSSVIDFQQIYDHLGVIDSTLPPRSASTDFAYGDPREFLSASTVLIDAINTYCWTGVGKPDPNCLVYPPYDIMLHVLGSYGLSGTITMSDGMRGVNTLISLPFCSAVPNRTAGLSDPANKRFILNTSTPCPARRAFTEDRKSITSALSEQTNVSVEIDVVEDVRSIGSRRKGPMCLNPPDPVTGAVDCSSGLDLACGLYYYQVCILKLPPYMAWQVDCTTHSDCAAAYQAPYCTIAGSCAPCGFCQVDADDSVDQVCPQDVCPGSGHWPRCISGIALSDPITPSSCPVQVPFSVWAFHEVNSFVDVMPTPSNKVRFVTPSNLLIGSIVVTQRRGKLQACTNHGKSSVKTFFNSSLCRTTTLDGTPYGLDPSFLPSSSIYNGKLEIVNFYSETEIIASSTSTVAGVNVTTRPTALGFFPQSHGLNKSLVRAGEENIFRLFFDGRITTNQANSMVTYMIDGGFIDDQTSEVTVEFVTFSPSLNKFSLTSFSFYWEFGGKIIWDFEVSSFAIDLYNGIPGQFQLGLEVISIIFLMFSTLIKLSDLLKCLRAYNVSSYLSQPTNIFHWLHIILMWYGFSLWVNYYQKGSYFSLNMGYPILHDPQASARQFRTDIDWELKFLGFMDRIKETAAISENYRCIAGLCAFLFIFSLLEAFRFQPRLGLLTRTVEIVALDIINYCILFVVIFGGFAVAATLMFGHQVYKVSTLEKSVVFLFFLVRLFDPTQYWNQFGHSAPQWAFQLWVWSFTFIFILGLFNILLALLIEGYMRAASERNETTTVPEDLSKITQDITNRIFMAPSSYMSDLRLKAYLTARKAGLPSSRNLREVIVSHFEGSVDRSKVLSLPGGIYFRFDEMLGLIEKTEAGNSTESYNLIPRPPPTPDEQQASMLSANDVSNTVIETIAKEQMTMALMHRYSSDFEDLSGDENEVMLEICKLEHLLRKLIMFTGHVSLMSTVAGMGGVLVQMAKKMLPSTEYLNFVKKIQAEDGASTKIQSTGQLSVTVIGAEDLPFLDLFTSPDAYCVLFLAPRVVQRVGFGCQASRTKVVKNTRSPAWMERFRFEAEKNDEYFVLTLFDSDALTNDTMFGCVVVRFRELRDGEAVDTWFDIELSENIINRSSKQPRIHLQLQYTQRRAGLALPGGDGGWAAT